MILFRGKEASGTLNHTWVVGSLDMNEKEIPSIRFFDSFENKCAIFVNPSTIGEYTGFTDPYGRKIFEGDILKIITPDYEYITKVYSEKNTLCVDVGNQEKICTPIGLAVDIWNDECFNLKVVGNIFDNPELLEVEE